MEQLLSFILSLLYHTLWGLSRPFLKVFWRVSISFVISSLLFYSITSLWVCQDFFFYFFSWEETYLSDKVWCCFLSTLLFYHILIRMSRVFFIFFILWVRPPHLSRGYYRLGRTSLCPPHTIIISYSNPNVKHYF